MLLIGSDPEFILERDGTPISSHTAKIPGDKDSPVELGIGHVHRDNVMAELSVPPSRTRMQFVRRHTAVKRSLQGILPKGTVLSSLASADFDQRELWHPEAEQFGCAPDVSAWDTSNPLTASAEEAGNFRVAGGHIHIGYDNPSEEENILIAQSCDIYMGLPSVLMDKDRERRKLYGKAGSFRHKPYGVEYRALSNFWMANQRLMGWVYGAAQRAYKSRQVARNLSPTDAQYIEEAINTYNETMARELCDKFGVGVFE